MGQEGYKVLITNYIGGKDEIWKCGKVSWT
jgi:hypothetical protein